MPKLQAPVGPDHLRVIGSIAVNFALLESTVSFFVWELIGTEQKVGQIVTAEISFRTLLDIFGSIYRHKVTDTNGLAEIDTLLARCGQAEEKRNAVMHSVWAVGHSPSTVMRFKTTAKRKRGFDFKSQEMSVNDLDAIAEELAEAAGDIRGFGIRTLMAMGRVRTVEPKDGVLDLG